MRTYIHGSKVSLTNFRPRLPEILGGFGEVEVYLCYEHPTDSGPDIAATLSSKLCLIHI